MHFPPTVFGRLVASIMSVVLLLLISTTSTLMVDAAGAITWKRTDLSSPFHQSAHIRLSLIVSGTFEVGSTVVRLATNDCSTTGNYINYTVSVPANTVSQTIPYLSSDDLDVVSGNSGPWVVGFRPQADHLGTDGVASVLLCYSHDRGDTWMGPAATAETASNPTTNIVVWKNIPSTVVVPLTAAVAGDAVSFFVQKSVFEAYTAADVYGVLVTDRTACDQQVTPGSGGPSSKIAGPVSLTDSDYSFKFTLSGGQAATKSYLCVTVFADTWSLAPVDQNNFTVVAETNSPTFRAAPFVGYEIRSGSNTATYACIDTLSSSTTLTAGRSVTCTVTISGVGSPSAGSAAFDDLRAGDGDVICPFPTFTTSSGKLVFSFTPQTFGPRGLSKIRYAGQVLPVVADAYSSLAVDLAGDPAVDGHVKRFLIEEGDPYPQSHTGTNVIGDIDGTWTGFADFQTTDEGLRWPVAHTASNVGEDISATLRTGVTTGALQKDISIASNQLRFQLRIKYFLTATLTTNLRQNTYIGRVRVSLLDSGGTEVEVVRDLSMFSYLRGVVIEGSDRDQVNDGDIRFEEQLQVVGGLNPNEHATIRVRLEIDHTYNQDLWFIAPNLQFTLTADASNTDDITALQAFYTAVGTASTSVTASWRNSDNSDFNGDPCYRNWKGVRCRFGRVVGLDLMAVGLAGDLPPAATLGLMTKLEFIDLRGNALTGTWNIGTGSTVLNTVRITGNQFTAIDSAGTFVHSTQTCLTYFNADNNLITALPTSGLLTHTTLRRFNVQHNAISQAMPSDFSGMVALKELALGENMFTGSFPSVLPLFSLSSIDVSFNQLTGAIPRLITAGSPLNQAPPLPNSNFPYDPVSHFQQLDTVDVSRNQFAGIFPIYPFSMTRFGEKLNINAQFNFFTNTIPRHFSHRSDFSGNFFTCPLPFTYNKLIGEETFAKPLVCDNQGYVQPADST